MAGSVAWECCTCPRTNWAGVALALSTPRGRRTTLHPSARSQHRANPAARSPSDSGNAQLAASVGGSSPRRYMRANQHPFAHCCAAVRCCTPPKRSETRVTTNTRLPSASRKRPSIETLHAHLHIDRRDTKPWPTTPSHGTPRPNSSLPREPFFLSPLPLHSSVFSHCGRPQDRCAAVGASGKRSVRRCRSPGHPLLLTAANHWPAARHALAALPSARIPGSEILDRSAMHPGTLPS